MGDSFIQVPADSTGKKVRTQDATVGANTVQMHYFIPADEAGNAISSTVDTVRGVNMHVTNPTIEVATGGAFGTQVLRLGIRAALTNPTAVADGQAVAVMGDKMGRIAVTNCHVRDLVAQQQTTITSSSAETTFLTSGTTGVFNDLTYFMVSNVSPVSTTVTVKDATAGTTRFIIDLGAGSSAPFTISPQVPIAQAVAANNWSATLSSASAIVNIFAQAIKNL